MNICQFGKWAFFLMNDGLNINPAQIIDMKRITLIVHMFMPESSSGTEVLTYNIAKSLQKKGYEVSIISAYQNNGIEEGSLHEEVYDNLSVYKISYQKTLLTDVISRDLHSIKVSDSLKNLLHLLKPDIIQFTHLKYVSAQAIDIALQQSSRVFLFSTDYWFACPKTTLFNSNTKFICDNKSITVSDCVSCMINVNLVSICANTIGKFGWLFPSFPFDLHITLEKRTTEIIKAYNKLSGIFAPSQFMENKLIEAGVDRKLISVIPFAQDVSISTDFRNNNDVNKTEEVTVAFIGTIIPEKGAHVYIDVVKQLYKENIKIRFKLYGDLKNKTKYVEKILRASKHLPNLEICGTFKQENFEDVLKLIDIVIVPSIWHENSPLVAVKSALAGKWLIMSDVGGLRTIMDYSDKTEYFETGNALDCSLKLSQLIKDWHIRKLKVNTKNISEFSDEIMTKSIISKYMQ